jgi:hypothetical protein
MFGHAAACPFSIIYPDEFRRIGVSFSGSLYKSLGGKRGSSFGAGLREQRRRENCKRTARWFWEQQNIFYYMTPCHH